MLAASIGAVETVLVLIDNNADVNLLDVFHSSALKRSIENGYAEAALTLIEADADCNVKDDVSHSLTHSLTHFYLDTMIIRLSFFHVFQFKYERTVLMEVMFSRYFSPSEKEKVALALIKAGADTRRKDEQGKTAFDHWDEFATDASLRHRVAHAERRFDRLCSKLALSFFASGFEIGFELGCCQPMKIAGNTSSTSSSSSSSSGICSGSRGGCCCIGCGDIGSGSISGNFSVEEYSTSFSYESSAIPRSCCPSADIRRSAELLSRAFSHAHGGMNLRCMADYL